MRARLEAELFEDLRKALPRHMVPIAFRVMDGLPRNTNGKSDIRHALITSCCIRSFPTSLESARDAAEAWSECIEATRLAEFRLPGLCATSSPASGVARPCAALQPGFRYAWANYEPAMRAILRQREPKTFPFSRHFNVLGHGSARGREGGAHACAAPGQEFRPCPRSAAEFRASPDPRHRLSARFPYLADLLDIENQPNVAGSWCVSQARMWAPPVGSWRNRESKPGCKRQAARAEIRLATLLRPASQLARRSILAVRIQCHGFDLRHALRNGIRAMILRDFPAKINVFRIGPSRWTVLSTRGCT